MEIIIPAAGSSAQHPPPSPRMARKIKISVVDELQKDTITINVSGERYRIPLRRIKRWPNSLLADEEKRRMYFDSENNEYFFDRNRAAFESVYLFYHTSGEFLYPTFYVPNDLLLQELKFYGIADDIYPDDLPMVKGTDSRRSSEASDLEVIKYSWQRLIWEVFEYPELRLWSQILAVFTFIIILISILLFCIETLPHFKNNGNSLKNLPNATVNNSMELYTSGGKTFKEKIFPLEVFCIAWFTAEYIFRFIGCPYKLRFMRGIMNIVDLIAILPFYVALTAKDSNVSSLSVLRIFRLVRIFRMFKLSRYSEGLKVLAKTLQASLQELYMLVFLLAVMVVLFGSITYYMELPDPENKHVFESIPATFWWALVTMTTLGYGDMAPKTLGGRVIGALAAITGILIFAPILPVIFSKFLTFYEGAGGAESASGMVDEPDFLAMGSAPPKTRNLHSSSKSLIVPGQPRDVMVDIPLIQLYDTTNNNQQVAMETSFIEQEQEQITPAPEPKKKRKSGLHVEWCLQEDQLPH